MFPQTLTSCLLTRLICALTFHSLKRRYYHFGDNVSRHRRVENITEREREIWWIAVRILMSLDSNIYANSDGSTVETSDSSDMYTGIYYYLLSWAMRNVFWKWLLDLAFVAVGGSVIEGIGGECPGSALPATSSSRTNLRWIVVQI